MSDYPSSLEHNVVEIENLRKEYGNTVAVSNSSFTVSSGEVLGIVGPNGSGKTSTLKMIAGLIEPTGGKITISGYSSQDEEIANHIGFLPEESPLYEDMTGVSYLKFFANLYEVPSGKADERIQLWLDRLRLDDRNIKIGNMSKGMKRKIAITRSLINDPDVLIYDEPASGLDPLSTRYIMDFIEELKEEGKTIIFSAHNLYHVSDLCDTVVMMRDGEIITKGSLTEIRENHGTTEYQVYSSIRIDGSEKISSDEFVKKTHDVDEVDKITEQIENNGGEIIEIQTEKSSLEDIFLGINTEGNNEY